MRRSMNGTRSAASMASPSSKLSSTMTRRSTVTEEQNGKTERPASGESGSNGFTGAGPVTARLKMLEKKYAQVLEMQAKFSILDKWLQHQFGVKLFPSAAVNIEKLSESNPEDVENPFYALYVTVQRVKFLEEKVRKLEARPFDDMPELKPTSNYSSAHSFRNLRGGKVGTGGVKRTYGSPSPATTPKKAKMMPRPVPPASSNYPFKPSVKILPKDPNAPVVIKTEKDTEPTPGTSEGLKDSSPSKSKESAEKVDIAHIKQEVESGDSKEEKANDEEAKASTSATAGEDPEANNKDVSVEVETEKMDVDQGSSGKNEEEKQCENQEKDREGASLTEKMDDDAPEILAEQVTVKEEVDESGLNLPTSEEAESPGEIPVLEDATVMMDDNDELGSDQEEQDTEIEHKPVVPSEEEIQETLGGDISGSEASASSLTSSTSKPRLSTRRQAAAAAASSSAGKSSEPVEEEKPVMYTTRGRRHTVPRRYAEFTGHDNVVSILKSQQRAEKSAAANASKAGRRQTVAPSKAQPDAPPKIKKMVKGAKTPSPKKVTMQVDSDDGDVGVVTPSRKKSGAGASERPACVDALVDRVMAREVDSDGMVVLSEAYPNIYVNQQQLIMVVVRSNGKSTRLTRKMTTLVFEDSVLASASPFGTKYYKDRLPPEPLEAMVDFIAESGFEPHYSKKKIYMIVGQVCNEARAGRVSRKFMQPMDPAAGPSGTQPSNAGEESEVPDADLSSPASDPSCQTLPQ